jgi:hypothetical protein
LTTIFVIYKIRNQQGVPVFARLVESFYSNERAGKAAETLNMMLSSIEKEVGWVYWIGEVPIMDQLETSPEVKKDG